MKTFVISFLLVLFSVPALTEIQVSISSAENQAALGDRIRIKIMAKTAPDIDRIKWSIPKKNFEIISEEIQPRRQSIDYTVFETRIFISFFDTGNFSVGPFSITAMKGNRIKETKETNSLEIRIKSVLKKDDRDIKELKELIPLNGNPFYVLKYVFFLAAAAALIISMIFFIKNRRRKKKSRPELLLTPLEELESEFQALLGKKLFEKGRFKEFFIEMTDIIKHFLSREYRINAEDFTTAEILDYFIKKEKNTRIPEKLESLFDCADLVKFAKRIPSPADFKMVQKEVSAIISHHKEKYCVRDSIQNAATAK